MEHALNVHLYCVIRRTSDVVIKQYPQYQSQSIHHQLSCTHLTHWTPQVCLPNGMPCKSVEEFKQGARVWWRTDHAMEKWVAIGE